MKTLMFLWTAWKWPCSASVLCSVPLPFAALRFCTTSCTSCRLAPPEERNPANLLPACLCFSIPGGPSWQIGLLRRAALSTWGSAACAVVVLPHPETFRTRLLCSPQTPPTLTLILTRSLPTSHGLRQTGPLHLAACIAALQGACYTEACRLSELAWLWVALQTPQLGCQLAIGPVACWAPVPELHWVRRQ